MFRFPAEENFISSEKRPDRLWDQPSQEDLLKKRNSSLMSRRQDIVTLHLHANITISIVVAL